MVRKDPRHLAQEAARREREAWAYLSLTTMLIFVIVVAFLWWTW
jgi:predicted permease